jgi:hypothetical protein
MEYAALGRTGLRVSRVGCGGGGIGQVWGPTTEAESVRTIHRAPELGVNFFDVAPGYGHGKAEEVLGACPARAPGAGRHGHQGAAGGSGDARCGRRRPHVCRDEPTAAAPGDSGRAACPQPVHATAGRPTPFALRRRCPGPSGRWRSAYKMVPSHMGMATLVSSFKAWDAGMSRLLMSRAGALASTAHLPRHVSRRALCGYGPFFSSAACRNARTRCRKGSLLYV